MLLELGFQLLVAYLGISTRHLIGAVEHGVEVVHLAEEHALRIPDALGLVIDQRTLDALERFERLLHLLTVREPGLGLRDLGRGHPGLAQRVPNFHCELELRP